jgi:beta-lactamase regulating signal transducer with metallopeptidase domain
MYPILNRLTGHLLTQLADASMRAVVLATLIALALIFLRRRPAVQHAMWTVVTAGMLVLPLLRPIIPVTHLPVTEPAALRAIKARPDQWAVTSGRGALSAPLVRVRSSALRLDWQGYVTFAYLVGVLFFAARVLLGAFLARRVLRETHSITRDVQTNFPALAGVKAEIQESDRVRVPMATGILRSRVILPVEWRHWSNSRALAVLTHELAHVHRRDPLVALLAATNKCVFWFHPLAWWLERHLAELAEHAADNEGLAVSPDAESYARTVVAMASRLSGRPHRLIWNSAAMSGPLVARRVRRILDPTTAKSIQRLGSVARVVLASSGALLLWIAAAADFQSIARAQANRSTSADYGSHWGYLTAGINAPDPNPITVAEASAMELQLRRNPEDESARALLLQYYWKHQMEEPRVALVLWLIDHHPESPLHGDETAGIFLSDRLDHHPGDPDAFAEASRLWWAQVSEHPQDARVLGNAARALGEASIRDEIDLLKRAQALDPSRRTKPLASLYSELLVWDTAIGNAHPPVDPALAAQIRSELQTSTDIALVGAVALNVVELAVRKSTGHEGGSWDFPALRSLAADLVSRTETLDPQDEHVSAVLGGSGRWADLMEGVKGLPVAPMQSSVLPSSQTAPSAAPRVVRVRQPVSTAPRQTGEPAKFELVELHFEGDLRLTAAEQSEVAASIKQQNYSGPVDGVQDEILERVRAAWQDRGYFKVIVTGHARVLTSGPVSTRLAVTAHVDAGLRYSLGEITFEHNRAIGNTKALRALFPIQDGDLFSRVKIAHGLENLRNAYGELGYINFTAVPETRFDDTKSLASIAINIDEGQQFRVSGITFLGGDENVLASLLPIKVGDVYNRRLMSVFFKEHADLLPAGSAPETNVHLQLDEAAGTVAVTLDLRQQPAH